MEATSSYYKTQKSMCGPYKELYTLVQKLYAKSQSFAFFCRKGPLFFLFPIISSIIFIISYVVYAEVLRENVFLSRTIEVQKEQKVIDTGLYGIVRHPMYTATIFLFLSIPLILGSIISFVIFLVYPFIIIKRLKNEEEVLEKELKGYKEYKKKVKYRLIPYIW